MHGGSNRIEHCASTERVHLNPEAPNKQLNRLTIPIAIALSGAVHGTASAAPGPIGDGPAELEEVTVYARRMVPVSRVAATVTVISDSDLQRTLAGDVKQMVRYEPGLSVRSDPFRFGLDTFTIRGMTGNRVSVEVDGIPSAPGFAIGSYSDSGRAFPDLAFVQARGDPPRPGLVAVRQRCDRGRRRNEHLDARFAAGRRRHHRGAQRGGLRQQRRRLARSRDRCGANWVG